MGPGSFEASEKLGLSKVTMNSHFSFNGFLKSIPAGFAPGGHLTGPCGSGAVALPNRRQLYSIPSGEVSFMIALVSPIVNGSYLTFTKISTPLAESAAAACTCGTSDLKSQIYPG
jgi:hypothetical protein